jgi:hypothetical protein
MKTQVKGIDVQKAIELDKPFVGSLKSTKNVGRPVLKAALVTNEYVIATDSHRLIRIRHNETVSENYLHHYKKDISGAYLPENYPQTERLIPDTYNAQKEILINVGQWLEAHNLGLVAAKEYDNRNINLSENVFEVKPCRMKAVKGKKTDYSGIKSMKGYKDIPVPEFDQLSFRYTIPFSTAIEHVTYNCQFMLDALKVFKKLGCEQIKLYFFGPARPMLLVGGDVEIIILPIRSK